MYDIRSTKRYRKSFARIQCSKNFDLLKLNSVIDILAGGFILPKIYQDHALGGDMQGTRECHVKNDLLLVYKIEKKQLILILIDIGSHASIFE